MKKLIVIFLVITLSSACFGQTEKQLLPSDLKQQTIVTEPVTLRKGFFRLGLLIDYRVADKYFNDGGNKEYYLNSSWGSKSAYSITLQYGLSDRFQVDLISEYMNALQETQTTEINTVTNTTVVNVSKNKGLGLGDSRLAMKYQIIPEVGRKFSLTGAMQVIVPTGQKNPGNIKSENQYDLPVGDGTYAIGINLSARKLKYPYSFSGFAGYTFNFNGTKLIRPADLTERQFRLGNLFESGLSVNLHLNEWIVLANEVNFYYEAQGKIEDSESPLLPASWALSYEPSLVFQVHRFRLGEFVRIPLKGWNVPADPLYILMVQYIF